MTGSRPSSATTREFAVEGMMCQGCVETVTAAITKLPGVHSAKVSLDDKKAVVVVDPQTPSQKIEAAINAAGYNGRVLAARPKEAQPN